MSADRAPVVLTIAGFDPSGGAGIIADVRTIEAFGCWPAAAITSVTFQNSNGVLGSIDQTSASVRSQILSVIEENEIAAVKTGMLPGRDIILEVAQLVRQKKLPPPVIDPVLQSSSGYELMELDALRVLVDELVPVARLITPNIPEAERLTGLRIEDERGMREAACKLKELGARAVLIKGGHLWPRARASSPALDSANDASKMPALAVEAIDLLNENGDVTVFRDEWIDATDVRGTGCMLSSAIAACLGQGKALNEAVRLAKKYVNNVIRHFAGFLQPNLARMSTSK